MSETSEHEYEAHIYIELFKQAVFRKEELEPKRYNNEFMTAFGVKSPTAPIVQIFTAFVAGIDLGEEVSRKLNDLPNQ